jgi:hypothetical protein
VGERTIEPDPTEEGFSMKRNHVLIATVAAFTACLSVPLSGAAAGPSDVVCSQVTNTFTGTARDLIVPTGGYCAVTGASITHDLIQQDHAGADVSGTSIGHDVRFQNDAGAGIESSTIGHDIVAAGDESGAGVFDTTVGHDMLALGEDSGFDIAGVTVAHDVRLLGLADAMHAERLTIGHDFFASKPQTVQTGQLDADTPGGPVKVGHDFAIDGSPDLPFVFDGICSLNVAHDFSITNRSVTLGFGIGNICARDGLRANTVGRDMVITGNTALVGFFGPSALIVGDNHVGRDLVFSNNTAVSGGSLEVSRNVVGRDARCAGNNPAVTVNGPNSAGGSNTCG